MRVDGGEPFFCFPDVGADACLLHLDGGDVDRSGVVRVGRLASFGLCLGELAGEELSFGGVAVLAEGDLGLQLPAETREP
jgi:hypothetical protein